MDAVSIDPHKLADSLGIDMFDLAKALRGWGATALGPANRVLVEDFLDSEAHRLEVFDEAVAAARSFLENAVVVQQAYYDALDSVPDDEGDEEA